MNYSKSDKIYIEFQSKQYIQVRHLLISNQITDKYVTRKNKKMTISDNILKEIYFSYEYIQISNPD